LIADDNDVILSEMEKLLSSSFDVVGLVANGDLLVKEATASDPDIVATDLSMPVINGLDAVKALKKAGSKAHVVFFSVFQQQCFVDACFGAGADAFVVKARIFSDLIPALEAVLAGRRFVSSLCV
jgi:DNA-binding NarL/FixJ family response regulator